MYESNFLSLLTRLPFNSLMILSNKQQQMKRSDVRAGDLPWDGKHFPVPSSPFRWLGWTGCRSCTPRYARTVCNTKHRLIHLCSLTALKISSLFSLPPLTWCSHSDTESCPLCCSRWYQYPPAELGSKSIWGSACASSAPWKRAESGQRSSPHILHTTWGPEVCLTVGCWPWWWGPSEVPAHTGSRQV